MIVSAALFAIAFPPFPLFIPVLVCLVPIAITIARLADGDGTGWDAARVGLWFGILGYGANLYWIAIALLLYTKLAILGYLGTLIWLGPAVAIAAAALFTARRLTKWPLALLLPIVWVASELMLNHLSDLSFPWLPLGLSMSRVPVMAQLADVSSVRTVSFWIAAINGLLADAWLLRNERHRRGAVVQRIVSVLCILAVAWGYGAWRMSSIALKPLAQVAIVQPDIPEEAKLNVQDPTTHVATLTAMTRYELRAHAPQLILWPEAALDQFLWRYPNWLDSLRAATAARPTPILTGVMDSDNPLSGDFHYYNAAIITDANGHVGGQPAYRKQYLVPIVERVPFVNPAWFHGMNYFGAFSRGVSEQPFEGPFGKVGTMICYESIYPELTRAYATNGAVMLANITNDAWFQRSSAPYQHFAHLAFRAIETRLPIVRAANTGISGYIDPLGRVRAETPIFVPKTETYAIQGAGVQTLYLRLGDWLSGLCAAVTGGLLLVAWRRRRIDRGGVASEGMDAVRE